MREKTLKQTIQDASAGRKIKYLLKHRGRFGIFAGMATLGLEKFLFEVITKHKHLNRSEVPIHVIADITGCFLGEKGASLMKKIGVSEKYSQAVSLAINGASHTLYEVGHHSMYHTHGHEVHSHALLLFTLITIKIIGERWYHNREHKTTIHNKAI